MHSYIQHLIYMYIRISAVLNAEFHYGTNKQNCIRIQSIYISSPSILPIQSDLSLAGEAHLVSYLSATSWQLITVTSCRADCNGS